MGIPDSPEGVALALLQMMLDREAEAATPGSLLFLYAKCLAIVRGDGCVTTRLGFPEQVH